MNRILMLTISMALVSSCATWKTPKAAQPGVFKSAELTAPDFFFSTLSATYFGGKGRLKGELGLIISAPDQLLLEVRGPGGSPVSTFACDGKTVSLFEMEGPRFYTGPANPLTMSRLLPLPVEPEIAVDLLRGRLPMPETATTYRTKGSAQQLSGEHPTLGRLRVTRFSPKHWQWELPDEDLKLTLKDPTDRGVFREIVIKTAKDEVALRMQDLESGGEPPSPELFRLEPPPGVAVQPL